MSQPFDPLNPTLESLRAHLEESIDQARRGETVPFEDVLADIDSTLERMRARRAKLPAAE